MLAPRRCASRVLVWIAIIVLGFVFPAKTSLGQNALVNSGFETGALSPWFQDIDFTPGGVDWGVANSDAHSGHFSGVTRGNQRVRQDFSPIPASSVTQVSFWIRHPLGPFVGEGPNVPFNFFYDGATLGPEVLLRVNGTEWTFFDVTQFLDRNRMLSGFGLYGYTNHTGTDEPPTHLDDVSVQVPEPATMLVGACVTALMLRQVRLR